MRMMRRIVSMSMSLRQLALSFAVVRVTRQVAISLKTSGQVDALEAREIDGVVRELARNASWKGRERVDDDRETGALTTSSPGSDRQAVNAGHRAKDPAAGVNALGVLGGDGEAAVLPAKEIGVVGGQQHRVERGVDRWGVAQNQEISL